MSKRKTGMVYLVGAGPGDPGLLTVRGAELLGRAEVVVHDGLVAPALLRQVPPGAEVVAAGKRDTQEPAGQETINQLLIHHAQAGKNVVRLKGGDPFVFGRGGEEAEALVAAGIPFEVVPGVSSFSAVPACAGIPLTHRGQASAFTVVTGHEDPLKPGTAIDWRALAQGHGTKVILMGVDRLESIAAALQDGGLPSSTPVAVIRWGSTCRQVTVSGTLQSIVADVTAAGLKAPAVIVVGGVVGFRERLQWLERRPLFGRRVVVTRSRDQAAPFAARLTELGADVLEIPTIRVGPPTERTAMVEALAGLGEYDWIIFTSPNGVDAFFNALFAAYTDIRSMGNLRIAAVGPATAARLHRLHLRVDAMPKEFLGKHVAKAIAETESLENLRVLIARAEVANPDLCRELEDQGAIVDDVAFYQTIAETADPGDAGSRLQEEGVDWITFTSGSTVEHFHARFDLRGLVARFPQLRLASIGPETTRVITGLGLKPAAEANPHTTDGLIQALIDAGPSRR